jgi:hypothetical protein
MTANLTHKQLQLFLTDFYSRDSEAFLTRNTSKQRTAHFESGKQPNSKETALPTEPQRKRPGDTEHDEPEPKVPRTTSRSKAGKASKASPAKKALSKAAEFQETVSVQLVEATIAARARLIEDQVKTTIQGLTKRLATTEATVRGMQAKLTAFMSEAPKQTAAVEKKLTLLEKRLQTAQEGAEQNVVRLEAVLTNALRMSESAMKQARESKEEAEQVKIALVDYIRQEREKSDQATKEKLDHERRAQEAEQREKAQGRADSASMDIIASVLERQSRQLEYIISGQSQQQQQRTTNQLHAMPITASTQPAYLSSASVPFPTHPLPFYPPASPTQPWKDPISELERSPSDFERAWRIRRGWFS